MHLAPASLDPQLIKDILQYCKGLIASIKNNHALVEQSFYNTLPGDEDISITSCNPDIPCIGKDTSTLSSTSLERPLSGTVNQPCVAQLQGTDSQIHVLYQKKAPIPDWTCTPSGDLKVNISWNCSRQHLMRQLSQDVWTRLIYPFLTVAYFMLSLSSLDNACLHFLIRCKRGNLFSSLAFWKQPHHDPMTN